MLIRTHQVPFFEDDVSIF